MSDEELEGQDSGSEEEVKWVAIAEALGPTQAAMIVNYLQAEGIQAWTHGGTDALVFSVGELGKATIMVQDKDVEEALMLLREEKSLETGGDDGEQDVGHAGLFEAGLLASAAVINPVGAALGLAMAYLIEGDDEEPAYETDCPQCDTALELSAGEVKQGWFICPECDERSEIQAVANCPNCQAELELSQEELAQGLYRCPDCLTVNSC